MAIDFGVFSALRGVTSGMANSRAEARKAEAAAVNQLYTDYQNKQQQNLQYEMQTADYFDKVNEIANEGADLVRVSCPDRDSSLALKKIIKQDNSPVTIADKKSEEKITEGKADKAFTKIIGLLRKESRKLNDDDAYELSTKLKAWFNKNVM